MMHKKIISFMLVMVMVFGLLGTISVEAKDLKLFVDGEKVSFSEDLGFPFIDGNSRTQVPFRAFSEAFGLEVSWDGNARVGYAIKDNTTIAIPVGEYHIIKNGKQVKSDTENIIINDRIHIPLRIVMESFDCTVEWDGDNRAIYVTSDGSQQPTPPNNEEPVATSKEALRNIKIGDDLSKVTATLGQPKRTDTSEYGFKWHIYNDDYSKYLQVGINNNKVVALYTNASYWALTDAVKYGAAIDTVKQDFGVTNGSGSKRIDVTSNNIKYSFLVDSLDGNKVTSILMMDSNVTSSSYYGDGSAELRSSYEKEIFDLANVERVNKGLESLKWQEDVTTVARNHSKDMCDNNYFNHTNLQGQSPWERASELGIKYSYYGENIAMGQKNAIDVVNGWMNSSGHRKNILSNNYTHIGVGVWFAASGTPYYTQNFISY